MAHSSKTIDMTEENIYALLISFALPLLAGNIFQQLYNTVDSVVVGKFVGKEALAAIGSTTPLINTFIGAFMGIASGGGVIISQYFGSHNVPALRKTVHTMILGTLILSVFITILGIASSPLLLKLMATPDSVFNEAYSYLRIYFLGSIGLMIYNMGAGILRAVGDSKRPLYFLIASSLLNVALDLLFVVVCKLGIKGVAYATIICEFLSALLVILLLLHSKDCYSLRLNELSIDKNILKKVIKVGLPAGLQMTITAFSNVFVQRYINNFGDSCMAGWASYSKIDQFVILPMQSLSLAATTFTGQNYGANKIKRVKEGVQDSIILAVSITILLAIPVMIFAKPLVQLFNSDKEVVKYGEYLLHVCMPFYVLCCLNQIHAGALRGLGNAAVPMFIMLGSFVVFRQIYLFTVSHITSSFVPISVAYPVGWFVCSAIMSIYYKCFIKGLLLKAI